MTGVSLAAGFAGFCSNGGYVKDYDGGCNMSSGTDGAASTDSGHGAACFNGEAGANKCALTPGSRRRRRLRRAAPSRGPRVPRRRARLAAL